MRSSLIYKLHGDTNFEYPKTEYKKQALMTDKVDEKLKMVEGEQRSKSNQ